MEREPLPARVTPKQQDTLAIQLQTAYLQYDRARSILGYNQGKPLEYGFINKGERYQVVFDEQFLRGVGRVCHTLYEELKQTEPDGEQFADTIIQGLNDFPPPGEPHDSFGPDDPDAPR